MFDGLVSKSGNIEYGKYAVRYEMTGSWRLDFSREYSACAEQGYDVYLVCAGEGYFTHGNALYDVSANDIIVCDTDVEYSISTFADDGLEFFGIHFGFDSAPDDSFNETIEEMVCDRFINGHKNRELRQNHILLYLDFCEKYTGQSRYDYGFQGAVRLLLMECLMAFSESRYHLFESARDATSPTLKRALDFIDINCTKRISIDDICQAAYTSRRNLQYLFQMFMHKSVVGYVNERRIKYACMYLQNGYSVGTTGTLVGIPEPSQFSRMFTQYMGISAKKYKELYSYSNV